MIDFLVWKQDRAIKGKHAHTRTRSDIVVIEAPAGRVLQAFFDADALGTWWQVAHAVTTPRALGPYALEWGPTDFRDEVLGRLGGVFRGTVMQVDPERGFFVADAYWLPPEGDPIGPMALEVSCRADAHEPCWLLACASYKRVSRRVSAGGATTRSSLSDGNARSRSLKMLLEK